VGDVTSTGANRPFDEAGWTQEDAVLDHLSAGIKQADASLERRRRGLPKEPEAYAAARRLIEDADG
jgi:hypothetical protein